MRQDRGRIVSFMSRKLASSRLDTRILSREALESAQRGGLSMLERVQCLCIIVYISMR